MEQTNRGEFWVSVGFHFLHASNTFFWNGYTLPETNIIRTLKN